MAIDQSDTGLRTFIDEDVENRLFRVNRKVFTSEDVFRREVEEIWSKTWLFLGHESEIRHAGDFRTRIIGGRSLIFCRDQAGEIQVFLNSCPHRGTMVCREAEGNTKLFQCFYHAWTFDTSGNLVMAPGDSAYPADIDFKSRYGLRPVPRLESYRGFVFISFAPDGTDLQTHLAGARTTLDCLVDQSPNGVEVVAGCHLYSARTNWKMAVENALDAYHFSPTHATFLDYQRSAGFMADAEGGWRDLGNGHVELYETGLNARAGLVWQPKWGEAARQRIEANVAELRSRMGEERAREIAEFNRESYVFPNLLTFDFIGLSLRLVEPVAPGMTNFYAWQLAPVGEPPEARSQRLNATQFFLGPGGLATPDDIEAQQLAQLGFMASVADPRENVPWSDVSRGMERELRNEQADYLDEAHIRAFWRNWNAWVGGRV
jgi:benzoate/toluate 1,2-dioxygenase alpha subunit